MHIDAQQKGNTTWIFIVLLVIAIVLAICFYTQKRIIENDRDNLAAEMQSTKQMSISIESAQQDLETIKKEKEELRQKLTIANDSIAQLQKELDKVKNQLTAAQKKTIAAPKKTASKTSTKSTARKTKK